MIRGGGREEHPREGGKRKESKEAEDLCDRIVSEKVPLEQRLKKARKPRGKGVPGKRARRVQSVKTRKDFVHSTSCKKFRMSVEIVLVGVAETTRVCLFFLEVTGSH